jgi:hypothetical protein
MNFGFKGLILHMVSVQDGAKMMFSLKRGESERLCGFG